MADLLGRQKVLMRTKARSSLAAGLDISLLCGVKLGCLLRSDRTSNLIVRKYQLINSPDPATLLRLNENLNLKANSTFFPEKGSNFSSFSTFLLLGTWAAYVRRKCDFSV